MERLIETGRIVRFSFVLANFGLLGSLSAIVGGDQPAAGKIDLALITLLGWVVIAGLGLIVQKGLEFGHDRRFAMGPPRRPRAAALAARVNGRAAPRRW